MSGSRLTLPDKSIVWLDDDSLRFRSIEPPGEGREIAPRQPSKEFKVSAQALSSRIRRPKHRFLDALRRVSDHPRYSLKWSVEIFDVASIASAYGYADRSRSTMFDALHRDFSRHFLFVSVGIFL